MFVFSLSIKNLLRNKRKTLVLGLLIAATSLLVFVMNAVFEQTNTGLKSLFVNTLTGDYLITENSEKINSIFGYEMPMIAQYEPVPQLHAFLPFSEKLSEYGDSLSSTPLISAAGRIIVHNRRYNVLIFGIEKDSFFSHFKNIVIEEGDSSLLEAGKGGALISKGLLDEIEQRAGRIPKIGDTIQINTYASGSFRIRKATLAGVVSYPSKTEPFDKIMLVEPQMVRELLQYSNAVDASSAEILDDDFISVDEDFDDLFSDFSSDIEVVESVDGTDVLANIENLFSVPREEVDYSSIITWSFISVTAKEGVSTNQAYKIITGDVIENADVQLMNWSKAAGLTAQAPVALQTSMNIGMGFIIFGAILVIMNGLVLSVLERTNEIGTMRAIGASNRFIRTLFSAEMMILILFFTIVGIILGYLSCIFLQAHPITLNNSYLITLFGSEVLFPLIKGELIIMQVIVSMCIALVACQYPVSLAIKIQPAQIMGKNI